MKPLREAMLERIGMPFMAPVVVASKPKSKTKTPLKQHEKLLIAAIPGVAIVGAASLMLFGSSILDQEPASVAAPVVFAADSPLMAQLTPPPVEVVLPDVTVRAATLTIQ